MGRIDPEFAASTEPCSVVEVVTFAFVDAHLKCYGRSHSHRKPNLMAGVRSGKVSGVALHTVVAQPSCSVECLSVVVAEIDCQQQFLLVIAQLVFSSIAAVDRNGNLCPMLSLHSNSSDCQIDAKYNYFSFIKLI